MTARGRAGNGNVTMTMTDRLFTVDANDAAARSMRAQGFLLRAQAVAAMATTMGWDTSEAEVLINRGKRGVANAGFVVTLWRAAK